MILLIPVSNLILSSSFSFKFHYDSINSEKVRVIGGGDSYLNSIMILLILIDRGYNDYAIS